MSLAEKLTLVAQRQSQVYAAGKEAELTAFWEMLQAGGSRRSYLYGFYGKNWTDAHYRPLYPIVGDMQQIFASSGITDTKVPLVVDGSLAFGFNMTGVKIVRSLDLTNCTNVTRAFNSAAAIQSIGFVGLIKVSGLDVSNCIKLDKASLLSLLNCLEHKTDGGTWEVTLGGTNKGKLTAKELAIAQNKGWTVK